MLLRKGDHACEVGGRSHGRADELELIPEMVADGKGDGRTSSASVTHHPPQGEDKGKKETKSRDRGTIEKEGEGTGSGKKEKGLEREGGGKREEENKSEGEA